MFVFSCTPVVCGGSVLVFLCTSHCLWGDQCLCFYVPLIVSGDSVMVFGMYLPLFVGILCWSLILYYLLCVLCSFEIILTRKKELVALR